MTAEQEPVIKITRRSLISFISMLAIAGFIFLVTAILYGRAAISQGSPPVALPVDVARISQQESYTVKEYYSGRVEAGQAVNLAFEQAGKVLDILVDEGAVVKAGDLLAQQDTLILQANLEQTTASINRIKAQVELAELTEVRQQQLFEQGHSTEQRYDEARLNVVMMKAQMSEAEAALKLINVSIEKSSLYAPFDGIVGQRFVDQGGVLNAGMAVVNLMETGKVFARISVAISRAKILVPGTEHIVLYQDNPVPARVIAVRPDVNALTGTQDVLFTLSSDTFIAFGELVELQFTDTRMVKGYWVPTGALVEGAKGLWDIFVVAAEGDVHIVSRRSVEVIYADTSRVYVAAHLDENCLIVMDGTHRVVPGQRINPQQGRGA